MNWPTSPGDGASASNDEAASCGPESTSEGDQFWQQLEEVLEERRRAHTWEDEANAPRVDEQLVRAWVRKEVTDQEVLRNLWNLTLRFRSWSEARLRIAGEEYQKKFHN